MSVCFRRMWPIWVDVARSWPLYDEDVTPPQCSLAEVDAPLYAATVARLVGELRAVERATGVTVLCEARANALQRELFDVTGRIPGLR